MTRGPRRCTFCGLPGADSCSRDAADVSHQHHRACRRLFARWLAGEAITDADYQRAGRKARKTKLRECASPDGTRWERR